MRRASGATAPLPWTPSIANHMQMPRGHMSNLAFGNSQIDSCIHHERLQHTPRPCHSLYRVTRGFNILRQIMVTFLTYISNACHSLSGVAERLQHTPRPLEPTSFTCRHDCHRCLFTLDSMMSITSYCFIPTVTKIFKTTAHHVQYRICYGSAAEVQSILRRQNFLNHMHRSA